MGLERINVFRKQKGLSVEELSKVSGVPLGTLSKITAGITKNPNLETVKAIATALGCSLDDFDDNQTISELIHTQTEQNILLHFSKLNAIGQNEAIKRIEELTYIRKYAKEEPNYLQPLAANNDNAANNEELAKIRRDFDKF